MVEIEGTLRVTYGDPTREVIIPVEGGHEIRVTSDVSILLVKRGR